MVNSPGEDVVDQAFTYDEMTTRNIGFVSQAEQDTLRDATVFVCGTGGMGGACILALARAGIGHLILADIDRFELSNLNRQVFATLDTVGQHKADATRAACLRINPALNITVYHDDWPDHAEAAIKASAIVVNGTDDLGAALLIYRLARLHRKAVVDAYAAPLPSVYVTQPGDPMPEERLGYPTIGTNWNELTADMRAEAFLREAEYVIVNSAARHHINLALAGEVAAGTRSRMSFAPMVISTGMLMAYEVIGGVLGKTPGADCRGWFFNPYRARVEHPRNVVVAALLRPVVRRFLKKMMAG